VGGICRKGRKEGFQPGMKEWGVMDDGNVESMEPMEEVDETYREKNL